MENQKISIELPVESWNGILQVLGKLPFEQSASLIFEIKNQAEAQAQALQSAERSEEHTSELQSH